MIDTIVSQNSEYGVDHGNITKLVTSGTTAFVDSLSESKIQEILTRNKGISPETQGQSFSSLGVTDRNKVKNKVSDFLDKNLTGMEDLKLAQRKVKNANRKAVLNGKIDINSQLNKLL